MTTYTTAAGYERDIPMTSDLDTEPSREDFEKVFKSCHAWIGPEFFRRDKTCPDDYLHIEAQFAWLGFQSAVKQINEASI